jgi:hypothetical protein
MPSTFSLYLGRLIDANLCVTLRSSSLKYGQEGANHREVGTHRGAAGAALAQGGDVCVSNKGDLKVSEGTSSCQADPDSQAVAVNESDAVAFDDSRAMAVNNSTAVAIDDSEATAVNDSFAFARGDCAATAQNSEQADGGERPVLTWPDVVSACIHRLRHPTPQDRPRSSLLRR